MKAIDEFKLKANYKVISDWIINLSELSQQKGNLKFTQECLKIQEMILENWHFSNEQCQEERALKNEILEMGIHLLERE